MTPAHRQALDALRDALELLTNTAAFDRHALAEWVLKRAEVVKQIDALLAASPAETPPEDTNVEWWQGWMARRSDLDIAKRLAALTVERRFYAARCEALNHPANLAARDTAPPAEPREHLPGCELFDWDSRSNDAKPTCTCRPAPPPAEAAPSPVIPADVIDKFARLGFQHIEGSNVFAGSDGTLHAYTGPGRLTLKKG